MNNTTNDANRAREKTHNLLDAVQVKCIGDALAKGHTYGSLVDVLRAQGLHVSERLIGQVLRAGVAAKKTRAAHKKVQQAGIPAA